MTAVALPNRCPFKQPEFANLMVQIILRYRAQSTYRLHGFVVMPDHMHLLITPTDAIERAIQCLKGGFTFAVRDRVQDEIWQPGYEEHCILDADDYASELRNIETYPIRCNDPDHPFVHLRFQEHLDAWPVPLQ
ncbi:MAG TPA: transposase [Granulicella sp.]|nr:transposase [Granulicella sp.]